MAIPTILRPLCLLIAVGIAAPAMAQTIFGPPPPDPAPARVARPTPTAPVIQRQPRAVDVPATTEEIQPAPLPDTSDDATMNRMIRGICRGC